MINKNIIYITGLPRAGLMLTSQLLGQNLQIETINNTSFLCQSLVNWRSHLSNDQSLSSQLDQNFQLTYQRLINAYQGFVNGWFNYTDKNWITDISHHWLNNIELLHSIDPNFKMLICIRELGQIYASIETQHQQTLLLDFPQPLAKLSHSQRALNLFSPQGIIGESLQAIEGIFDLDEKLQKHLYYVVFEHLISEPLEVMQSVFNWLEIPFNHFDSQSLKIQNQPCNIYNNFKYPHHLQSLIKSSPSHHIPPHFNTIIKQNFTWYYKTFYPGLL